MFLDMLDTVLTFITAPRKRAFLATQAKEILHNRQPPPLSPPSTPEAELEAEPELPPIMSVQTQNLPPAHSRSKSSISSRNKSTGFPEPLSPDRNTTLPHPDADTSENATIEAQDIDLKRTHSRRSFLSRHHSAKGSGSLRGVIPIEERNIQYAVGSRESKGVGREVGKDVPVKEEEEEEHGEKEEVEVRAPTQKRKAQRLSESSGSSGDEILKSKLGGLKDGRRRSVLRKLHLRKT